MNATRVLSWVPERILFIEALPLLLMAMSVFFFLSPGYEMFGFWSSITVLLLQWIQAATTGAWHWRWMAATLLPVLLYSISAWLVDGPIAAHLQHVAISIAVFVAAYLAILSCHNLPLNYLIFALALPFAMHLIFFLSVVPHHLIAHSTSWLSKFETMRTVAQIGPKLLGQALIMLIPFSVYALFHGTQKYERRIAATLFSLACISLALIDSRAAYLCLAIGIVLAIIVHHRMKKPVVKKRSPAEQKRLERLMRFMALVALFCVVLAVETGWHRLKSFQAAVDTAWHNEAYTSWITPETWVDEFCIHRVDGCKVDSSVYLRTSWIKFGLTVIADHPFGIGPSANPLSTAIHQYYPTIASKHPIYDSFHNQVLDMGVNYGIPGILLLMGLLLAPLYLLMKKARMQGAPAYLPLLTCLWGTWITRGIIDDLSIHLLFTAWAYAGFIFALLSRHRPLLP